MSCRQFFFFIICICIVYGQNSTNCVPSNSTYDLSKLASKDSNYEFIDSENTTWLLNFCQVLVNTSLIASSGCGAGDCSACQIDNSNPDDPNFSCIGKLPITYTTIEAGNVTNNTDTTKGVIAVYSGGKSCQNKLPRTLTVTVLCGLGDGGLVNASEVGKSGSCLYGMQFNSSKLCGGGGFDIGWIFVILVVSLAFIYLVVGSIFNWKTKGASGIQMIPNYEFWMELPGLLKDGFSFLLHKISCGKFGGRSEYTPIK